MSRRVLLISHDPVGAAMAGLGIRTFELGRVLREHADVTIAHAGTTAGELDGMRALPFPPHDYRPLYTALAEADTVVCHPVWPALSHHLRRSGARIVHDLYDPETLETLELFAGRPAPLRRLMGQLTLDRLHDAIRTGHHLICASEQQRDLWTGALLGLRALDPALYDADPSLRDRLDVVPFGVPDVPPPAAPGPGPREAFGLGADAEIILWNGGIWRWLDAETAIRGACRLAARRPTVKLVFMGGSASGNAAASEPLARARALTTELGALGSTVHFHAGWVPYAERAGWLAQAGCVVSTHPDHLETRFAFRTRLLDCFWAGVPIVCTRGDALAGRVERDGLGATVAPGDADGVAGALAAVLDAGRPAYAGALARTAAELTWARSAAPLVRWITAPGPLPPRLGRRALAPPPGQWLREAGYRVAGRAALATAARRRGG